jgi:hypothetical protein
LSKFRDNWLDIEDYKLWLTKVDDFTARCNLCNKEFTIKYEGLSGITKHKDTNVHKEKVKSIKMSQTLSAFVTKVSDKDLDVVAVAEVSLTYHTVRHHLSYASSDCIIKLIKHMFPDSKQTQHLKCGRMKMEAIAENILCPLSITQHLNELKDKKFSVASDASNKGNVKLFPIGVQYFNPEKGIVNFVLDFYEDPYES